MGRNKKFEPGSYPIQTTVSFPKVLRDVIDSESKRLNITKAEFVRQCVLSYALKTPECNKIYTNK